jgi:hypothetical protein
MLHHAPRNAEAASGMTPCVSFCVRQSVYGDPPGANFPVAETFMNNVPNGSNLISNWAILARLSACTVASISWTRSADVDGRPLLCSSITFTRLLLNYLHHLRTCYTVITLAPYTVTSLRWISTGGTFFAHKKTNYRLHFFFCPLFQYGRHLETTAVSVHVTWGGDYYWYLVVNICTNWTHAYQLNAGILSAGIK